MALGIAGRNHGAALFCAACLAAVSCDRANSDAKNGAGASSGGQTSQTSGGAGGRSRDPLTGAGGDRSSTAGASGVGGSAAAGAGGGETSTTSDASSDADASGAGGIGKVGTGGDNGSAGGHGSGGAGAGGLALGSGGNASGTGGTGTGGYTSGTGGAGTGGYTSGTGGAGTGGYTSGTGGAGTGGSPGTGGAGTGGRPGTGGSIGTGGATGTGGSGSGKVFSQCRFHFGTTSGKATGALVSQLDFFTPGWMLGNFSGSSTCKNSAPGGSLAGLVPVVVTYVAAAYVKGKYNLCDCNVAGCAGGNLCQYGAQYIVQEWANILAQYQNNSTGYAACMGGRPIVFEMEPDWYQYTGSSQNQRWTAAEAGTRMTALVKALGGSLPNAVFSMDISPWIPNNGSGWYPNFDMSLFTFINTSGGNSDGSSVKIRSNNSMTWAGVSQVAGKPILADTGYGAGGGSSGEDPTWNVAANINARMLDGVVSISQYNPSATWATTIANLRGQLNTPPKCY